MAVTSLARAIGSTLLLLVVVSILIFVGTEVLPGDTATSILGQDATVESAAALRESLGLDRSPFERYFEWVFGAIQGDFGQSIASDISVGAIVGDGLRNSLLLAAVAFVIAVPTAAVLGVLAGAMRDRLPDHIISSFTVSLNALPEFLIGSILIVVFGTWLQLVPSVTTLPPNAPLLELVPGVWLPALTLAAGWIAYLVRTLRSSLIDTLASPFARQAKLAGLSPKQVVLGHALRPALPPVIATGALYLGSMLGGVVVVETVFNYPGLGMVTVDAVRNRDIPVVQAVALVSAIGWALTHLLAEALISGADPRTRTGANR